MATRGLGTAKDMPASSRLVPRFAQRFWLPPGKNADIVLLDDESYNVWEHGLFIKGDKQASQIKVTCPDDTADGDPKKCRVCNAMLKGSKIIGRHAIYVLTMIDLGFYTNNKGEKVWHTKRLLCLDREMAMVLAEKKSAKKRSFVGAKFRVYRADQRSNRVGNDWDFEGMMNLKKYFADSPSLPYVMDRERRFGNNVTKRQAVDILVSPIDYDKVFAHDPKKENYLLTYIGLGDADAVQGEPDVNYDDERLESGLESPHREYTNGDDDGGKKKGLKKGVKKKKAAKKKAGKKKAGKKKKGLKKNK